MSDFAAQVDVREYPPKDRQAKIFGTYDSLKPGEQMELVNDHDPKPLRHMFMAELPDQFIWNYLEEGPDVWRVAIQKKEHIK
ncbi:DUF2249 domain-containing protein [Dethiobacter alkaliphilus]|uniref:DUF2249 domain-containing protein n=1 Tax=Dethiobacter alkaliphilus AHT 1 TaxID=555088 RepID=C0GCJ5_DETAL|nr:DUF2249 domain-containing protein [Dethiobacter alkaliphilus]EEG78930.1 conserved hypothetical protein [Dethiobacter alkaliphilus AHT 1]